MWLFMWSKVLPHYNVILVAAHYVDNFDLEFSVLLYSNKKK